MNNLIEIRRELHRRAELSFEEHRTQQYICSTLASLGIDHRKVAGTGVIAVVGDRSLPAVVLRADIDALPIAEASGVDFASDNHGVMHACGHDIHAAALIGALADLAANPPQDRVVVGLFQPGEEVNPGGASIVLKEGALDEFDVRAVVGQHCSPELPVGEVGYRAGQFMASTDEVHFVVRGVGGHAARPEELKNPVRAAVELLWELDKIHPADDIVHLLAFGRIIAEGATNVIPNEVTIGGTFRTFDENWRKQCKAKIAAVATQVAARHGLSIEVDIRDGYPVVFNDEKLTDRAVEILRPIATLRPIERRLTAEDFGHYGVRYPSLFVRLGVGTPTKLHTAQFRPDERAIDVGGMVLALLGRQLPLL